MIFFIREARFKPTLIGVLKQSSLLRKLLPLRTGGTDNSRYCYSVWLRHLCHVAPYNNNNIPNVVAELGPGDSFGIGIAALLSGAKNYFAFDVLKFWQIDRNLKIFDDLLNMFYKRERIPDNIEFPNVAPGLTNYSFPSQILTEDRLKINLTSERIVKIKKELTDPGNTSNNFIYCKIPWDASKVLKYNSVDLIVSQAVLEHVDDLENAYKTMYLWLSKDGFMSHTVDFKCHGFTKSWNGYWALSDSEWKLVRGGRVYAINRQPLSVHLDLLKKFNFILLEKDLRKLNNSLKKDQLADSFKGLSNEDISTSGMYILVKKHIAK